MRSSFLYGSFLVGHASRHGRLEKRPDWEAGYEPEVLGERLAQRSLRFGTKGAQYGLLLPVGLVLALGVTLAAFRIPYSPEPALTVVEVRQELVTLEEIAQTRQEMPPPAPPRPPVPIEVPNDVVLDDVELDLDATLDLDQAIVDLPPPLPAPPTPDDEPIEEEMEIFVAVEQMPQMIGGVASLMASVTYPEMARKAGVEGTVIVQIIVDEKGIPQDPQILRSASELLDEEAVQAVMLQRFEPGKQRGRAVKVKMAIPVIFRLRNASN